MADEVSSPVREGEVLAKKYRVEKVLGVGGMGVVVSALHLQLEQRVALKFLLPSALANADVVERFAREARAAARIKSEHVARVLDVGELDTGSPFMVMEFLEGEDLARVSANRGPLPVAETVGYVLEACDAIAEAHAGGIVHRDLKPSNLFVATRPDHTSIVKVLDFGISKATSAAGGQLTSTQALLGSPLYMSPEQMTASRTVDPRSDIWALGVILYELLSGTTPFVGETMPELVAAVLSATPQPLSERRPEIPLPLAAIVARCLEKDRAARFPSVAALATALAPWGPDETRHLPERISRVLGDAPSMPRGVPDITPPSPEQVAPASRFAPKMSPSLYESAVGTPPELAPAPSPSPATMQGTIARSAWGGTRSDGQLPTHGPPVRAIAAITGGVIAMFLVLGVVRLLRSPAPQPAALVAMPALETPAAIALTSVPSSVAATPATSQVEPVPSATTPSSASAVPALTQERPATAAAVAPRSTRATGAAGVASAVTSTPSAQPLPAPPIPAPAGEPINKLKMDVK